MEMTIPAAIQKQVEDAERIQQEIYGEQVAPVTTENTPAPEAQQEPVAAPELKAEPNVEPVHEPKPSTDFEQQYKVIKGKYEAEVPRMQHQLREQARQMQDLMARLERAERQPEVPKAEEKTLVSEKDVEDFGGDLVDMVRRASREESQKLVATVMSEFERKVAAVLSQVGQVQERVVMSESEKFWNRVTDLVPDWSTVDQDQSWIDFLDTAPEYTTESYRDLAAKAIQAGKAEAVAKLVGIWRGPQHAPQAAAPQVNAELQRQVVPSTVKSSAPVQPAGKVLTKSEYEALYDPRNAARYGQKKADEMLAEADRAVAEGRVRW